MVADHPSLPNLDKTCVDPLYVTVFSSRNLTTGPDSMTNAIGVGDKEEQALVECQAILEKKTMAQMSLGFAVAVKHYLRGEEGM